ncbi:hypothetical protein NX059_009996 [Plenodomus lindquistii]|nr:hypothetical protein NX059_009996 [Plenodomus lindquistii]
MYPPRPLARRQQNYAWDQGYMYQSKIGPSYDSYPLQSPHLTTPFNLHSRIAALNRRAAIVSANLAHRTTVGKPLKHTKLNDLTETQLQGMEYEGVGSWLGTGDAGVL